jgi:ferrochelatase
LNYLILNQLGTPKSPEPDDVGAYLREFLMDQNVIKLSRPFNDILVKIGIVPRRKFSSSEKYKKIWTAEGSPLAVYTEQLRQKLQAQLGSSWTVITAMRYGEPSIGTAVKKINFENAGSVVFLPLYPQFAQATVGSAIEKLEQELKKIKVSPSRVKIIDPFYNRDWYINALAATVKSHIKDNTHLLLSYHGIPLSQEKRSKTSYYQQCLQTTELLTAKLGIEKYNVTTAFQSRVGLAKWLEPSTTDATTGLASSPDKELVVVCPSFVADCLETIEEIGMELKAHYLESGGKSFKMIPCLNSDQALVDGIIQELK